MKEQEIKRAMEGIMQEMEAYGKYRERKGSDVYDHATSVMSKYHVIIQSRRSVPHYWYPGKNYAKAQLAGPADFIKSRRAGFPFFSGLNWKSPVLVSLIWFLFGVLFGTVLTWLLLNE